jgi:hypothetical protein
MAGGKVIGAVLTPKMEYTDVAPAGNDSDRCVVAVVIVVSTTVATRLTPGSNLCGQPARDSHVAVNPMARQSVVEPVKLPCRLKVAVTGVLHGAAAVIWATTKEPEGPCVGSIHTIAPLPVVRFEPLFHAANGTPAEVKATPPVVAPMVSHESAAKFDPGGTKGGPATSTPNEPPVCTAAGNVMLPSGLPYTLYVLSTADGGVTTNWYVSSPTRLSET